jgi:spermidine synthase
VICDFPDPSNFSLGKLYSIAFYRQLRRVIAPGGYLVVQSTSPFVARKSFWCIVETLKYAGFTTSPYHVHVPSFGEWGFVLASESSFSPPTHLPEGLRFLSVASMPNYFSFPPDMAPVPVEANRLNNQVLVHYFEREWAVYSR